jgi:hypothetical protein
MIARGLRRLVRRFAREEGTATVEFVILFPVFMVLTVSAIEMGVLTLRQAMIERGVDLTVRNLRVGTWHDPSADDVKHAICNGAAIIPNCLNVIHLELRPISTTTWQVPSAAPTCVDRTSDVKPVVNYTPGKRNELMLLRACVVVSPMFAHYGLAANLPLDSSGGYHLIASTAFVNEP